MQEQSSLSLPFKEGGHFKQFGHQGQRISCGQMHWIYTEQVNRLVVQWKNITS